MINQAEMRGNGDERKGDNVFVFDASGSRMEPAFIDGAEFRKCSGATFNTLAGDPNSVTDFEPFHIGANFCNGAGEIATEDIGKRDFGGDHSAANVSVDRIHIDGGDFDEALGSARFGSGQIAVENDFGWTGFVDEGSFHNRLRSCRGGQSRREKTEVQGW